MQFKINKKIYIFQTNIIPLIATLLGLSILLSLCVWQVKRLSWKKELIETRISRFEKEIISLDSIKQPEVNEFVKVKIKGIFLNEKEMFMPALSKNGNNGYHILVPLKTKKGKHIIFDTGWVPNRKKNVETRKNHIDFENSVKEAVIRLPGRKGRYQPDNELENNFWFFVEPSEMTKFLDLDVEETFYLEAVNDGPSGYPLGGQTRIYIRNNHLQYAITWFLIACTLIGVFLASSFKLKKNK